jgi:transposase-like protein
MKRGCPAFNCRCVDSRPHFVRHGRFYRSSDSRWISRWKCQSCSQTFSRATIDPCFRQIKRRVNYRLWLLLSSGTSLRRCATLLCVNRITVVRKLRFLAEQCRRSHASFLRQFENHPISEIVFDEMETFEHTKFKPLSIALAVTKDRKILSAEVAQMPAKGLIAAQSRKKYGHRKDERPKAMKRLLETLLPFTRPDAVFKSDQNPSYPFWLRKVFPNARHVTTKGGRAAVVGQGELKKLTWDPIFALNHTAAMLRANMNRLFRRTWCTTKTPQGLRDHLALYIHFHNSVLLAA